MAPKPSWWDDKEAKNYKLCNDCKGLGLVLDKSEFVKCEPCKGKGYLKK